MSSRRQLAIFTAFTISLLWSATLRSQAGVTDHSQTNQAQTDQARTEHAQTKDRARIIRTQPLDRLDGDHLKAFLVEVHYGPGESSPPHSHPCSVIGYVLEGAIRTKVKGEAEAVYKTGETFYEPANGIHEISANGSSAVPARLLAYFVCDRDVPLSVAPPAAAHGGK